MNVAVSVLNELGIKADVISLAEEESPFMAARQKVKGKTLKAEDRVSAAAQRRGLSFLVARGPAAARARRGAPLCCYLPPQAPDEKRTQFRFGGHRRYRPGAPQAPSETFRFGRAGEKSNRGGSAKSAGDRPGSGGKDISGAFAAVSRLFFRPFALPLRALWRGMGEITRERLSSLIFITRKWEPPE